MAGETGAVWAIDIGHNSLKALYLSTERGYVEVLGCDNIQHDKILSGENITDAEREELIAISLRKLVTTYDLSMDEIAVSVPSQNSFVRFVNLPPVEAKRIPEMVKFEAVQQIPFDMNDIQWDWQLMTEPDSPELKVGIFAIKNEVANTALDPFTAEDIEISYVQIAPMALYNFLLHDRPDLVASDNQATVVVNIGATNTDLVVCTKSAVWQRCILIGGNNFTKAIADTFRLNFDKAEKLKRTAPMSKYARQIFQAMKPVFTDLASEVQRSLGFYSSANPNTKIVKVIAMGGGAKLRGLLKYMQQTLQIPVERPDSFKRLAIGAGVSQAKFHENVGDFGIVYGLALQGLGLAGIESNLLPRTIARSREWAGKSRYFIGAACLLLVVSLLYFARTGLDRMNYNKRSNSTIRSRIQGVVNQAQEATDNLANIESRAAEFEAAIERGFEPFQYREMIPQLYQIILSALPNKENTPEQAQLYEAFASGDVEEIMEIPRDQRKQIFITGMSVFFSANLSSAPFSNADIWGGTTAESVSTEGLYTDDEEILTDPSLWVDDGLSTLVENDAGFVVTIVGYSPYGESLTELSTLMDPRNVEDQRDKWGFITRLGNLDELVADGNSPFKLYKKGDSEQYKLDIREVSLDGDVGLGVGEYDIRYGLSRTGQNDSGQWVLVDPMTKEIISKIPLYNSQGILQGHQVNDRWFILNCKFLWKDSPVHTYTVEYIY